MIQTLEVYFHGVSPHLVDETLNRGFKLFASIVLASLSKHFPFEIVLSLPFCEFLAHWRCRIWVSVAVSESLHLLAGSPPSSFCVLFSYCLLSCGLPVVFHWLSFCAGFRQGLLKKFKMVSRYFCHFSKESSYFFFQKKIPNLHVNSRLAISTAIPARQQNNSFYQ